MKKILPAATLLFLSACSTGMLSDAGRNVSLVNSMSAGEVAGFDELGPVYCEEQIDAFVNPDEMCKNDLRNHASAMGATLVVMENTDHVSCTWPMQDHRCVTISGRAYRAKAPRPL